MTQVNGFAREVVVDKTRELNKVEKVLGIKADYINGFRAGK